MLAATPHLIVRAKKQWDRSSRNIIANERGPIVVLLCRPMAQVGHFQIVFTFARTSALCAFAKYRIVLSRFLWPQKFLHGFQIHAGL